MEKNHQNTIATSTGIGFLATLSGAIAGILLKDLALWLSIGVGSGMVLGALIWWMRKRKAKG